MIEPELLSLLGCPLEDERPPLREEGDLLICTSCGAGFPVRDGIPDLLPESAIPIEQVKEMLRGK
jgi:uncharacterized protein YbaR (Trm112 family)